MRSRQLGMSPAKIAIAVAVTIEAIAGTGSMKKVTGARSAVAIVAVRPGTAPTNSPNAADARITHRTYGVNTSASASKSILLQQSPRQRNAQQLVERQMDRHRGHDPDQQRDAPGRAEDSHPQSQQHHAGQMKPERVRGEDVEQESRDHARHAERGPRAMHPL